MNHLQLALSRWLPGAGSRPSHIPPLWREGRWPFELAALRRDPVFTGASLPPGRGRKVLLVPGYMAGDASLRMLSGWLRQAGYRPTTAGIKLNTGCTGAMLRRLEQHLDETKEPVLVIGQSRGGLFGRVLMRRRPDLVRGLITLGSPLLDPLGVHPLVLLNIGVVGTLGSLGVPGLFSHRCLRGAPCCGSTWQEIGQPLPDSAHFVSVYSRTDGIVDWHTCLDPAARHIEVDSSHLGMALNPAVYRIIAEELRRTDPTML